MRPVLTLLLLACLALPVVAARPQSDPERLPPPVPPAARPGSPVPPVVPVLTIDEFVRTFKSVPGRTKYEVVLLHPCTCQPVKVCFELPDCPRRVLCRKTEVVFRYGLCKKPVVVTFCRDGSVRVS